MKKPEEYLEPGLKDGMVYGQPIMRVETVLALIARVQADAVDACIAAIPRNGVTAKEAYISTDIERAIRALLPEVKP